MLSPLSCLFLFFRVVWEGSEKFAEHEITCNNTSHSCSFMFVISFWERRIQGWTNFTLIEYLQIQEEDFHLFWEKGNNWMQLGSNYTISCYLQHTGSGNFRPHDNKLHIIPPHYQNLSALSRHVSFWDNLKVCSPLVISMFFVFPSLPKPNVHQQMIG